MLILDNLYKKDIFNNFYQKKIFLTYLTIFFCSFQLIWAKESVVSMVELAKLADIAKKTEKLLGKMTVDEKIGQLNLISNPWSNTGPSKRKASADYIRSGKCGNYLNVYELKDIKKLQKIAVEENRLGIPMLFGFDVIHGYKTIFPIPLGMSASWDLEAIEGVAKISAAEAAASGINWTYSPMVDISRDPRWGRIAEGSGEDVFLGSEIAKAYVRGYQGEDLALPLTIAACAKDFAAYGAAQAGRDYHTVDISKRTLLEIYLPPFKASIDAGIVSIMTSFNEINGVPATGNLFILKKILRDKWGFRGMVVTDWTSIKEMIAHGFSRNKSHAALQAILAGVDMDMMSYSFSENLKKLLKSDKVTQEQIDNAVRNVLTLKYRLGLFKNPYLYCNEDRQKQLIYHKDHLEAAYEMACKSFVLLQNDNQLLPLEIGKKIAVIGPMAKAKKDLLGTWQAKGDGKIVETILKHIELINGAEKTNYAKGCPAVLEDKSGFEDAVELAKESEVVVMVLGEPASMSGEASSRSDITLPGLQAELVKKISETNKPIVLLVLSGRPLVLTEEVKLVKSILLLWHPGTKGGKAVADTIFGKRNPSGKLSATFPYSIGQLPIFYNYKNTGRPQIKANKKFTSSYIDIKNEPLFPFGFGLSFTKFEYSEIILDKSEMMPGEVLTASTTITNTGDCEGEEVIQLYIRDLVGSVTRPVKELKAFKKVRLKPGKNKEINFKITERELTFLRHDMTWGTEPGKFELFIGKNSRDTKKVSFELLE